MNMFRRLLVLCRLLAGIGDPLMMGQRHKD